MVIIKYPAKGRGRRRVINTAKKTKPLAKNTKKQVAKIARRVLNTNAEHKFFDTKYLNSTIDFSGGVLSLCEVPQTTTQATDSTRIGDSIMPKSIEMRLNFAYNANTLLNCVRIILFRWKTFDSTHGIAPTTGMILQYTGSDGASVHSPLIHDSRGMSVVIFDHIVTMDPAQAENRSVYRKFLLAKIPIQYFATGLEGMNKYYILLLSDQNATGTNDPIVRGYTRLNFTDL